MLNLASDKCIYIHTLMHENDENVDTYTCDAHATSSHASYTRPMRRDMYSRSMWAHIDGCEIQMPNIPPPPGSSSKGKHVRAPGSTNHHTRPALVAHTPQVGVLRQVRPLPPF